MSEFGGQQELERSLMLKQIARIVANAKRNDQPVSTYHSVELFANFPNANMSLRRILEELKHAAQKAGVKVE